MSSVGWVVHVLSTRVVNRLVFRGGWTVVVRRGDDLAPKRRKVLKRRYPTRPAAVAALDELARSGLPSARYEQASLPANAPAV